MLSELSSPECGSSLGLVRRFRSARPLIFARASRNSTPMVASVRTWNSAVCWVSPGWVVARMERDAVGSDGERYSWARLYVGEIAADAHVAVRVRDRGRGRRVRLRRDCGASRSSRLAVTNQACQSSSTVGRDARGYDAIMTCRGSRTTWCTSIVGDSPVIPSTAARTCESRSRELAQYNHFELRVLCCSWQSPESA